MKPKHVPIFAVVVGSAGRDTMGNLIESFLRQDRHELDQLLIVLDAFEKTDEQVFAIREPYVNLAPAVKIFSYDAGYHWYGVEQVNWGLRHSLDYPSHHTHVFTIGDDDVYVDGAFAKLRPLCSKEPLRPIMFRFVSPWRQVLWDEPRMMMSKISGCCIAAPRVFVSPMPTRLYVEHDFDWMQDIIRKSGNNPLWLDETLVIARPDAQTGFGRAHESRSSVAGDAPPAVG